MSSLKVLPRFLVLLKAWLILPNALGFSDNAPDYSQVGWETLIIPISEMKGEDFESQLPPRQVR